MTNEFPILGHAYSMRDPKTFGADVRIQQERKAYFNRTQGIGEAEPRSSVRDRFSAWMESVEDTSLDDILTLCALLEPIGEAPHLSPEYILEAQPWELGTQITDAMSFFSEERSQSYREYVASKILSATTTEASTPVTEESSMPESTSP